MTPKSQHTSGPWAIGAPYGNVRTEITAHEGTKVLASVWTRNHRLGSDIKRGETEPWPEGGANARLIAAAPEMLAALREVYDYATDGNVWPSKLAHWVDTTGELLERVAKAEQGDA